MEALSPLDPLLHSQLRLAIMSILMASEKADFLFLQEKTMASPGNLSVQLDKLEKAGYIEVIKHFNGKKPVTSCKILVAGKSAFEKYVDSIKGYLNPG